MIENQHIVNYSEYCQTCVYKELDGTEYPCDECLDTPVNVNTTKPINYKEEEK